MSEAIISGKHTMSLQRIFLYTDSTSNKAYAWYVFNMCIPYPYLPMKDRNLYLNLYLKLAVHNFYYYLKYLFYLFNRKKSNSHLCMYIIYMQSQNTTFCLYIYFFKAPICFHPRNYTAKKCFPSAIVSERHSYLNQHESICLNSIN